MEFNSINLWEQALAKFSPKLPNPEQIRVLDLDIKQLSHLPPEIRKIRHLEILSLYYNRGK
jgi:hypothetical protein